MNPIKHRPLLIPAVLATALWIAGLSVTNALSDKIPHNPSDAQILTWVQGNTTPILLGGWLWLLGCLAFLWFAALLRSRLAPADGDPGTYSALAFAAAAAAAVFGMLMVAGDVASAIDKDTISAATAGTLHNGMNMFFIGAELMMIPFFLATAIVALRTAVLSKWWSVLAILIAVVLAIGPIGWAALIFGTPVWLLGTGLIVGSPARARHGAVSPAAA